MNRRLQEIKRKVMTFNQELREIDLEEHVDWLIEQAERVQELEQQIKRYREALEAIAYFDDKEEGEATTRIDVKYIARKALEG